MNTRKTSSSTAALAVVALCSIVLLCSNGAVEGSVASWGKFASLHKLNINNNNYINKHEGKTLFGLSSRKSILATRGGSTKTAADDGETEEEAPVELYLPGLLDAVITTSDMVRTRF